MLEKKAKNIDKDNIYQIEDPFNIKKKYKKDPWWFYCQICNEYYTTYISKESIYICKDCRLKNKYCK